jgi:hypothetical protein
MIKEISLTELTKSPIEERTQVSNESYLQYFLSCSSDEDEHSEVIF